MLLTVSKRLEFSASRRLFVREWSDAESLAAFGRETAARYGTGRNYVAYFVFSGTIDPATGKDVAVGHEGVLGVAAAQKHFGNLAALEHQDPRRRIERPQGGRFLVDLIDVTHAARFQHEGGIAFVGAALDGGGGEYSFC